MRLPIHTLAALLEWSLGSDRPDGRARIWGALPFGLVTGGVYGYGVYATGKASGSVFFLALSAATLVEAARLLWGAARSLFTEPPALEVAVATGRRRKELEREKASLLKALKELEFDHEMRKVSDSDFAEIGGVYRARAIRVMRQLDERQVDYARLVEEELKRTGKKGGAAGSAAPAPSRLPDEDDGDDDGPEVVAPNQCAGCGTINDRDAVFCKKCAKKLGLEASA